MLPPFDPSPAERDFIENAGLEFDSIGMPRIGGRILGLMILSPRPLLLDEIARILQISRASVSINTRLFIANGIMELRGIPGERKQFYAMKPDAFFSRLPFLRRRLTQMHGLFTQAEQAVRQGRAHRNEAPENMAWTGGQRPSDDPALRITQGLMFLTFMDVQLAQIEAQFAAMFQAKL